MASGLHFIPFSFSLPFISSYSFLFLFMTHLRWSDFAYLLPQPFGCTISCCLCSDFLGSQLILLFFIPYSSISHPYSFTTHLVLILVCLCYGCAMGVKEGRKEGRKGWTRGDPDRRQRPRRDLAEETKLWGVLSTQQQGQGYLEEKDRKEEGTMTHTNG